MPVWEQINTTLSKANEKQMAIKLNLNLIAIIRVHPFVDGLPEFTLLLAYVIPQASKYGPWLQEVKVR